MASTTQPHPSFPTRPYSSTLHGKLPERNAPSAFSASAHPSGRENAMQRQERERAQREAAQSAGPSAPFNNITDEQREEINEAVCALPSLPSDSQGPLITSELVWPLRP
jgi:centrin-3